MPLNRLDRRGFSMVEIMVILIIVGIMATVSAPPIFRYVQSNRLATSADRMAADLQYARSLSIANSEILRFSSTPAGYRLTNPVSGAVIRENDLSHGLALDANVNTNFYPWGMADASIFNISNKSGARQINVLPTGIVEVH